MESRIEQTAHDILKVCTKFEPNEVLDHELIARFGYPQKAVYIDQGEVDICGLQYKTPLILPIHDGRFELIQCAVLANDQPVAIVPDGMLKGFSYYGHLAKDKPIILTFELEKFLKIAQTSYAVVLVVLRDICKASNPRPLTEPKSKVSLKKSDFKLIEDVIHQLRQAGYHNIYVPLRPEQIKANEWQRLNKVGYVSLLNQYQASYECEISKDDGASEVQAFLDMVIADYPIQETQQQSLVEPFEFEGGRFYINDDNYLYYQNYKTAADPMFISSRIDVIARTRDMYSNAWGRLLQWTDADGVIHRQAISMELFQSDGVELRKFLAYEGVVIASGLRARHLFQSYLMNCPTDQRALCVQRIGWYDNVFVLPHEQIGQHEKHDLIIYQNECKAEHGYAKQGSLKQWQQEVASAVEAHSKLVVALSCAFSGQLLTPLQQQTGLGLHFKGQSSKGKTTALYVGASVWGKPNEYCRTWKSTGNALEHTAYLHNDGFLALDEIGEISQPKELGNLIYMLANGKGKARMTRHITAKPSLSWKLAFVSTGEKSLKEIMQENGQVSKLGQEIRLIDIDVDLSEYGLFDQIDFAGNAAAQARLLVEHTQQYHGVAGISWLDYLAQNQDILMVNATERLLAYQEELLGLDQQEGHIIRVANAFAIIALAGELATEAGITGWLSGTAIKAVKTVFQVWLQNFEYVGDFTNTNYVLAVKKFLEANELSRFENITSDPEHIERISQRVGYWKIDQGEKIFYVFPEQFKHEVCKGHNSNKVAQALKQYGLLQHDQGKTCKTVRLPARKSPIKVYAIKEDIFSWNDKQDEQTQVTQVTVS